MSRTGPRTARGAPGRARHRGRAAGVAAGIAGLFVGAGLIGAGLRPSEPSPAPLPAAAFDLRGGGRAAPDAAAAGASGPAGPEARGVPTYGPSRLGIPSLGVDAPVVPEALGADGALVVPGDPGTVGRWQPGGSRPGGATVLAGHVSVAGVGDGALAPLHRIAPGALVVTTDGAGVARRWSVRALEVRHKDDLPDLGAGAPVLAIVTCGGPAVEGPQGLTFRDNVIAYAVPADAPPGGAQGG